LGTKPFERAELRQGLGLFSAFRSSAAPSHDRGSDDATEGGDIGSPSEPKSKAMNGYGQQLRRADCFGNRGALSAHSDAQGGGFTQLPNVRLALAFPRVSLPGSIPVKALRLRVGAQPWVAAEKPAVRHMSES